MTVTTSWPTQLPTGAPITDTRRTLAGLIARSTNGSVRAGVLPAHTNPIVTGLTSMAYAVAAFTAVTARVAGGCELVANDGSVTVATTAAPGSNRRIDVIWIRSRFLQHADGSNLAEIGVTQGVAAAIPTKPALPAGALELATAEIPSGATTTSSSGVVITQTHPYTAAAGGVIPFRSVTEMNAFQAVEGQLGRDLASGDLYQRAGSAWLSQEGGMRLIVPSSVVGATIAADGAVIPNAGGSTVRVNGVFSPKYRSYLVQFMLSMSAQAGTAMRLTAGGVAHSSLNYASQRSTATATASAASMETGKASWPGSGLIGAAQQGEWRFWNPAGQGVKGYSAEVAQTTSPGLSVDRGWLAGQDSSVFDGFEYQVTGGPTLTASAASFIKVYGLA